MLTCFLKQRRTYRPFSKKLSDRIVWFLVASYNVGIRISSETKWQISTEFKKKILSRYL